MPHIECMETGRRQQQRETKMTISITDKRITDRQFAMRGCGVSVDMIRRMIGQSDEDLGKAIAQGEAAVAAAANSDRADMMAGILRALKIERDSRKAA